MCLDANGVLVPEQAHEKSTCVAPRAFVVGGEFTSGWAQRWNLVTTEGAAHLFDGFSVLVSNTSGKLNWPHSVAQDACTGSLYIANANDNVIDELACSQPVVGDNFQVLFFFLGASAFDQFSKWALHFQAGTRD